MVERDHCTVHEYADPHCCTCTINRGGNEEGWGGGACGKCGRCGGVNEERGALVEIGSPNNKVSYFLSWFLFSWLVCPSIGEIAWMKKRERRKEEKEIGERVGGGWIRVCECGSSSDIPINQWSTYHLQLQDLTSMT